MEKAKTQFLWLGITMGMAFVTFGLMWLLSLSLLPLYISKNPVGSVIAGFIAFLVTGAIGAGSAKEQLTELLTKSVIKTDDADERSFEEGFKPLEESSDAIAKVAEEMFNHAGAFIAGLAGGGLFSLLGNATQVRLSFVLIAGFTFGIIGGSITMVVIKWQYKTPWPKLATLWILEAVLVTIVWVVFTLGIELNKSIQRQSTTVLALLVFACFALCFASIYGAVWCNRRIKYRD